MIKAPQIRLRTLLIVIGLTALLLAGVARLLKGPGRPYSTVLAQFDPAALLGARPGYAVEGVAGMATFNLPWGYAYKEWRGVVAAPNDPAVRKTVQGAIERYVEKVSRGGYHVEGTLAGDPHETPRHARLPAHALFMYNEREWHGDMHVWLFPDPSGPGVAYAIFLRETRNE